MLAITCHHSCLWWSSARLWNVFNIQTGDWLSFTTPARPCHTVAYPVCLDGPVSHLTSSLSLLFRPDDRPQGHFMFKTGRLILCEWYQQAVISMFKTGRFILSEWYHQLLRNVLRRLSQLPRLSCRCRTQHDLTINTLPRNALLCCTSTTVWHPAVR